MNLRRLHYFGCSERSQINVILGGSAANKFVARSKSVFVRERGKLQADELPCIRNI